MSTILERASETKEVRHHGIYLATGNNSEDDRKRTKAFGFDHHLVKPVDFQQLQSILKTVPLKTR